MCCAPTTQLLESERFISAWVDDGARGDGSEHQGGKVLYEGWFRTTGYGVMEKNTQADRVTVTASTSFTGRYLCATRMARLVTEWVNVTGDISIIARESGEVWFHTPGGTEENVDPFATPMTGVGSAGSTVGLLDGAINLGFAGIEKRLARPDPTLVGYIVALVGAYHTSVDTPRNLRRAAGRFNELGRPEVAAYLGRACARGDRSRPARAQGSACAGCARRATRRQLHSGGHQAALQALR